MPEYLAPGVYVEEVSFRAKSIEGISTSTTGFAGPARKGPLDGTPEVITSFGDFQRVFGGFENLAGFPRNGANFLAHAVQNYFDNGGSRLYVARVFQALGGQDGDGIARSAFIGNGQSLRFIARFPGGAGNGVLTLREVAMAATVRTMGTAPQGTLVRVGAAATGASITGGAPPFDIQADGVLALTVDGADQNINIPAGQLTIQALNALVTPAGVTAGTNAAGDLVLTTISTGAAAEIRVRSGAANSVHAALGLADNATANGAPGQARLFRRSGPNWTASDNQNLDLANQQPGDQPRIGNGPQNGEFISVRIEGFDGDGNPYSYEDLGLDRAHPRYIGSVLSPNPSRRAEQLENIFAIEVADNLTAFDLHGRLFGAGPSRTVTLTGGNDGGQPGAEAYRTALDRLSAIEDIAIIAAPGHSALQEFQAVQQLLIANAEARRAYRIAVLDTPPDQSAAEARTVRSRIDSKYAALYYPWVIAANPLARPGDETIPREVALPPSGFLCGIYARNDIERGVAKTPANEVVRGALRFERDINFGVNEVLNPLGINCLRYFPGRGFRVWGGRTVSSDPEFKYVNVRRYMNYVEGSVDRGTQWAVFENNGERLWANIRETVSDFLYNEWRNGSLLGSNPKEAFFVRCDRSTMTQNDLDNGRLVCLVGIAVLKPAEFVIFRIGQKTADART